MKKNKCIVLIMILSIVANSFCACGKKEVKPDLSSVNSVCELATLKCYYHNVGKYEVDANGFFKWLGSGYKKVWIEYSGIVKIGIDVSKLHISNPDDNNVIKIEIPDAEIQSVDIDDASMSEPYTDKGVFTKITIEEKTASVAKAQEEMETQAKENTSMLAQGKEKAKALIAGYIKNLGEELGEEYSIEWVDVKE